MGDDKVDITTTLPVVDPTKTITTIMGGLCNKARQIKADICSALSKTHFKDVRAADMCGKGNVKVSKELLASNVITLVGLIDCIDPIINGEPPVHINVSSSKSSDHTDFVDNIQRRLDRFDTTLSTNEENIGKVGEMLKQLESWCNGTLSPASDRTNAIRVPSVSMQPNTISQQRAASDIPQIDPYVRYEDNAFTTTVQDTLHQFVADNSTKFTSVGNCRDTLYFGEYGYKYSGGQHDVQAMPTVLEDLLQLIKPHLTDKDAKLNSCLVSRYKTGSDFIPPHRDDEPVINPESEIVTVSIGVDRVMKFTDNTGADIRSLTLKNASVLITNRRAQDFWLHEIEKSDAITDERVSFTFRHIAPHFLKSSVIIGDSNTRFLSFGEGKGNFGAWMPGKRVEAIHVENIPQPETIGPYRNIIIHTGINNIKHRNRRSNCSLAMELENKCKNILNVYPRSRIYLCLLLPTKLDSLNYRVKEFNNILFEISHTHRNISVIDYNAALYCDRNGLLKAELGRHDKETGRPLDSDVLHLGKKGLRLLAKGIKSSVFQGKVRRDRSQGQHTGSAAAEDRRVSSGGGQQSSPPAS